MPRTASDLNLKDAFDACSLLIIPITPSQSEYYGCPGAGAREPSLKQGKRRVRD